MRSQIMRPHQVVDVLGQQIVEGGFGEAGQLPSEEALSVQFAVSRTALREAIKVLSAKGLLEARPRAGTRVRPFEQWSLLDIDVLRWLSVHADALKIRPHLTQLREIIEPAAAALAASAITEQQMQVLQEAFEAMAAAQNVEQWVFADLRFHQAILHATNNPFLIALAAVVASVLQSLLKVNAQKTRRFNEALPEHQKVFLAIQAGDAQSAAHWMQVLLADTQKRS